jgi:hypothetical protein
MCKIFKINVYNVTVGSHSTRVYYVHITLAAVSQNIHISGMFYESIEISLLKSISEI